MTTVEQVILVACGSFNPITNMHLRMFELARDYLDRTNRYQVLAGLVSPVSHNYEPHSSNLATVEHRCQMIRLAIDSSDWLLLDRWEADQSAWSPTRIVLEQLTKRLKSHNYEEATPSQDVIPTLLSRAASRRLHHAKDNAAEDKPLDEDVRIMLLCGGDLLQSFSEPNLWHPVDLDIILRDFGLVCVIRPDFDPRQMIYESEILHKYERNIHLTTEWMTNEVNSARIRRSLRRGENVRFLLPDSVIGFIELHGLYDCCRSSLPAELVDKKESSLVRCSIGGSIEEKEEDTRDETSSQGKQPQRPPHVECTSRECQTRLSALDHHSLLVDSPSSLPTTTAHRSSRSSPPPPPLGHPPTISEQGKLELGEEAMMRLIKECSLCGSRRVRLMIVEGVELDGGSHVTSTAEVGLFITRVAVTSDHN